MSAPIEEILTTEDLYSRFEQARTDGDLKELNDSFNAMKALDREDLARELERSLSDHELIALTGYRYDL